MVDFPYQNLSIPAPRFDLQRAEVQAMSINGRADRLVEIKSCEWLPGQAGLFAKCDLNAQNISDGEVYYASVRVTEDDDFSETACFSVTRVGGGIEILDPAPLQDEYGAKQCLLFHINEPNFGALASLEVGARAALGNIPDVAREEACDLGASFDIGRKYYHSKISGCEV
jgi:hypothetical protein